MKKTASIKLTVDSRVHELMRELSKRRREYVSLTYERAAIHFLRLPENYMGLENVLTSENSNQERKVKNG